MRTRKRSKDQLRAIHASYANGYKRKGRRKKQKVVLKPKRIVKHTKITKTLVPKKEKKVYNPSNSKKESSKIWDSIQTNRQIRENGYDIRYTNNLNESFLPSVEYIDNISWMLDTDEYYDDFIKQEEYKDLSRDDYSNLIQEAESGENNEALKDLLSMFTDEYSIKKDKELNTYYLEADDERVNANPTAGQSVEDYHYKIIFTSSDGADNLFKDGNLVKPKEIMAIYNQREKRFLTSKELAQIKFSDKGIRPEIYQLENR